MLNNANNKRMKNDLLTKDGQITQLPTCIVKGCDSDGTAMYNGFWVCWECWTKLVKKDENKEEKQRIAQKNILSISKED